MKKAAGPRTNLEDGRGSSAAQTTGGVQAVHAQQLVHDHTEHAQHSSTAVVALSVQLEGLGLLVIVTHPAVATDVSGSLVIGLSVVDEVAGLHHAGGHHDLQPGRAAHDARAPPGMSENLRSAEGDR